MPIRPLHILVVYTTRFPAVRGGIDTLIRTLCTGMPAPHRISLLVPGDWEDRTLTTSIHEGVTCHRLRLRLPWDPVRPLRGFLAWLGEFPRTLLALRGLLRREGVDVLHLFTLQTHQYYFRLLRWLGGPPYLITFVGSDVQRFPADRFWRSRMLRWILAGAAAVSGVSPHLVEVIRHQFPERQPVDCVGNGLLLRDFRPEVIGGEPFLPHPYFVVVGCLEQLKGPETVVAAWGHLRQSHPELHLVLIGTGNPDPGYPDFLREMIRREGVGNQVHLLEEMERPRMLAAARHALGFISASRSEGLPYVLLEAGAMARPVIFSDIRPLSDLIASGTSGLLVPPDNPAALARAVARLAADPDLARRLGDRLFELVQRDYAAETMAAGYLRIYRRMTGMADPEVTVKVAERPSSVEGGGKLPPSIES
ncbi:MAG: glycosyltransferase family 4 protein [Magnetococcales bacterium]|nr:glycosyltransferase family 4 protein [Magnetococcales bacterium]